MKAKLQNPLFHSKAVPQDNRKDFYEFLDCNIRTIGTYGIVGGLGAAAMGMTSASEYLLASGALLHLISWFGDFWEK